MPEVARALLAHKVRSDISGVIACFATLGIAVGTIAFREATVGRAGMGSLDAAILTGIVFCGILLHAFFEARSQSACRALAVLPGSGVIDALSSILPLTASDEWRRGGEGGEVVRALARRIADLGPTEAERFTIPLQRQMAKRLTSRFTALRYLPASVDLGMASIEAMIRFGVDDEARQMLRGVLAYSAPDSAQRLIQNAIRAL